MRLLLPGLAAVLMLATPALAAEDPVSGSWAVKAKVERFDFTLTCDLTRSGAVISGTCYDGGTRKPHPLTRGRIDGDRVSWSYQSSFLGKPFSANYDAVLSGDRMTGVVMANGYKGPFTATR
jgi:hypothetical protein